MSTTETTTEEKTMMNASYRVIATDSDGREVSTYCTHKMGVQVPLDLAAARRVAAEWRRDPGLRAIRIAIRIEGEV